MMSAIKNALSAGIVPEENGAANHSGRAEGICAAAQTSPAVGEKRRALFMPKNVSREEARLCPQRTE